MIGARDRLREQAAAARRNAEDAADKAFRARARAALILKQSEADEADRARREADELWHEWVEADRRARAFGAGP